MTDPSGSGTSRATTRGPSPPNRSFTMRQQVPIGLPTLTVCPANRSTSVSQKTHGNIAKRKPTKVCDSTHHVQAAIAPSVNEDIFAHNRMDQLKREMGKVRDALRAQPLACDIWLLIFAAAASEDRFERSLLPLPPFFQDESVTTAQCDVVRLRRAVADNWPSCRVMLEDPGTDEHFLSLPPDDAAAFHLMHWLLYGIPTSPILRRVSCLHLRSLCRTLGVGRPTQLPGQVISICYQHANVEQPREPGGYSPSYAYLGLPFHQLYRFLATGRTYNPLSQPVHLFAQAESALVHCFEPVPHRFLLNPASSKSNSVTGSVTGSGTASVTGSGTASGTRSGTASVTGSGTASGTRSGTASRTGEQSEEVAGQSNDRVLTRSPLLTQPLPLCWQKSVLAETQMALVICQLPSDLDEAIAQSPEKHFLEYCVQDEGSLRPHYLLLFDQSVASVMIGSWPGQRVEEMSRPSLGERSRDRFRGWARGLTKRFDLIKRVMTRRTD